MLLKDLLAGPTTRILLQTICKRGLAPASQRPRPEKKHYRLWSVPGEFVHVKDILAKQYTMSWHPGLNCGIDNHRTIYALCDGIMAITEEEYKPDWDYPLVKDIYMDKEQNKIAPPYKRYIHVIPKHKISEFKLVDAV